METTSRAAEKFDSQNLRDFLRIKEEDHHSIRSNRIGNTSGIGRNSLAGLTLSAVLSDKRIPELPEDDPLQRVQSNRTLLDIIRDDHAQQRGDGRKSWRNFTEKLGLRRTASGSSWTSTVPIPASDIPINSNSSNRMMPNHPSTRIADSSQPSMSASPNIQMNSNRSIERASGRFEHTSSLVMRRLQREANGNDVDEEETVVRGDAMEEEEEAEAEAEAEEEGEGEGEGQPARMSLMALLAETDRQMGLDGSTYILNEEEDGDQDDEEEESGGGDYNNCCVCMVRHKGAAFIPCGHTFCRLCSRELLAQRGNCPLCNNYIVEILDIF